jgi:hypothetical protein
MSFRSAGPAGNGAQDPAGPALGMGEAEARLDEKMRATALLRIGHLLAEYCAEFFLRHARAGKDPLSLHSFGCGHERHRIDVSLAAGLEEQWDVEDDSRRVSIGGKEFIALFAHERMDEALENAQARFILE